MNIYKINLTREHIMSRECPPQAFVSSSRSMRRYSFLTLHALKAKELLLANKIFFFDLTQTEDQGKAHSIIYILFF